jgi:hypothetical protein
MAPRVTTPPAAGLLPVRAGLGPVVATSLRSAALLAITAVVGLLFGARGLYNPDPARLPTFLGQDGITLAVVLPLLLWSVWAARRGSLRGLLLWTAALFTWPTPTPTTPWTPSSTCCTWSTSPSSR